MFLNSDVGRFAHDIASPLTMVKLNLEQLKSQSPTDVPTPRLHLIERIEAGIDELSYLVTMNSQLKTPTIFRSTVIKEINKVLRLYDLAFAKHRINVQLDFGEDFFLVSSMDKFHRVMINLINNAISALEKIQHPKTICIQTLRIESGFVLRLSDNGCGICQENLPRLFIERFTTKPDGNGLGLVNVHKILFEYFNGVITCTSVLGQGTTFEIFIPD